MDRKVRKIRKIASFSMLVLVLLQFVFCLPRTARAEEDLTIPEWVVDASLQENGDLQITEDITFAFRDSFHGVFREIGLEQTSGVSDIRVEEITAGVPKEYAPVEDAENGDSGVFLTKTEDEKAIVRIYSPSEGEEKTFRLRYTIRNVAIRYRDTAELYYQFLGDENNTPIDRFRVNILLPQEDTEDRVRLFAHGPRNGVIRKEGDAVYSLYVENVPPDTFVEGRAVFPKEYIPLSGQKQNIDRYSAILEEEAAFQKKLEADSKRKEQIRRTLETNSVWASVFGLAAFFILALLFRREKNVYQSDGDTDTGIPEECTPAVAAYLTGSALNTDTVFATILDLVRRGYLALEKEEERRDPKSRKRGEKATTDDQDFRIDRGNEPDNTLLDHETHFIRWLLDEMGNGKSVNTRQIEDFQKENSASFYRWYGDWKNKVKEEAEKRGYYDRSKRPYGILLLIVSAALFVLAIVTFAYGSLYGLISMISAFVILPYGLVLLNRRSDLGYEQYQKWIRFRKHWKSGRADSPAADVAYDAADASLIYALGLSIQQKSNGFSFEREKAAGEVYAYNDWLLWYFLFIDQDNHGFQKRFEDSFGGSLSGDSSSTGSFSGGGGGGAGGGGAGGF